MEVIIKKGGKQLLRKLIGKQNSYEIVRLENEVVIFELTLELFRDDHRIRLVVEKRHMKVFAKNPI